MGKDWKKEDKRREIFKIEVLIKKEKEPYLKGSFSIVSKKLEKSYIILA